MADSESGKEMLAALGRIPSGIFILTARNGEAETGMLTSWVQQCSFTPPLVTVAVRKDREINGWLAPGSLLVLNILDEDQTDMIAHFGRGFAPGEPAFVGIPVDSLAGGPPVLREALAYLACQVVQVHPAGDHSLYITQVTGGRMIGGGKPMVHVRKSGQHY